MKKYIVAAVMAFGLCYTPSFAQEHAQSKKEDIERKRVDDKQRDLNAANRIKQIRKAVKCTENKGR